jgi:hypothetical protein
MRLSTRIAIGAGAFGLAVVVLVAVLLVIAGCSTATSRLQRQFQLSDVDTPEAIEAGLAAKVPIGTSEQGVLDFLAASGIGTDGLSSVDRAGKDGEIWCRIEYDPSTFGLVKESYGIAFRLDGDRRLASIHVSKVLTGL